MKTRDRSQLALGVILLLLGAFFIIQRQVPSLREWLDVVMVFPLNIIAIGAGLLLFGLAIGHPGMAIPAAIVSGIGGILYYQNLSGNFASWSYMWTLIPGFVGVGSVLAGLLGEGRGEIRSGANLVFVSAILFLIFASAFGGINILGDYGIGVLLALLGLWIIGRGLVRSQRKEG